MMRKQPGAIGIQYVKVNQRRNGRGQDISKGREERRGEERERERERETETDRLTHRHIDSINKQQFNFFATL